MLRDRIAGGHPASPAIHKAGRIDPMTTRKSSKPKPAAEPRDVAFAGCQAISPAHHHRTWQCELAVHPKGTAHYNRNVGGWLE